MAQRIVSQSLQKQVFATVPTGMPHQPINLLGVIATNQDASNQHYLQVFDRATLPTGGNVPLCELQCPKGLQESLDLSHFGNVNIATGLTMAASTTSGTYTDSGSAVFFVTVFYS